MKKLILLLILLPIVMLPQERYIGELRINLVNCGGSVNITFTLTGISARWDENYNLTEDYATASDVVSICTGYAAFDHVLDPSTVNDTFAVGLYKISAVENGVEQAYLYCDWRTSDWRASLDVTFNYDVTNKHFKNYANTQIIDHSYQTLWDLTPNQLETSGLEAYWNNCLALFNNGSNHPRLVWGPHPTFSATNYRIYRAVSNYPVNPLTLNYSLIQTVNSSTFGFIDNAVTILPGYQYAYYYVVGWNGISESAKTNYKSTPAEFHKIRQLEENDLVFNEFSLQQNYPNPFNPTTTIAYTIPQPEKVTLRVFDILGREVAELVNEQKETGTYTIKFDASNLTSGIYLYQIKAGDYSMTRKLILQK